MANDDSCSTCAERSAAHWISRQLALEAEPLRRRDRLEWRGPSRRPDSLPPTAYPRGHSLSPSPARDLQSVLLAGDGPAWSSSTWQLELVEPIRCGGNMAHEWGQVWRARAFRDEASEDYAVVVKLYDEALFAGPECLIANEGGCHDRTPAEIIEDQEATAYERARGLQGRDLPICYGFYTFSIRGGEPVTGIVLEDLTDQGHPLDDCVKLMQKRKEFNANLVENISTSAFAALARLHAARMTWGASMRSWDIFVLKAYEPDEIHVVLVGFGHSMTPEVSQRREMEVNEEFIVEKYPPDVRDRVWLAQDHRGMVAALSGVLDDDYLFQKWFDTNKIMEELDLVLVSRYYRWSRK
ncbi:hypothetical protein JCM10212_004844 [Sporobolomyces blumeae]